jgi:hypothetical protein
MIIRCYVHQWPQDYGRGEIAAATLPREVCGRYEVSASTEVLPQEAMGNPDALDF